MANEKLKTASVLAFERKLDPSDGLFQAGNWSDRAQSVAWPIVQVREKSVRGTISNRLKAKEQDAAKLDAKIQNPNLQTVDVATLPTDNDTLRLRFTLRVLGGVGIPSACNEPNYQQKLTATLEGYKQGVGFEELGKRYACNLANGRFLWRNRLAAEDVEVTVRQLHGGEVAKEWTFNAMDFHLRDFDVPSQAAQAINELAGTIQKGLDGISHVLLDVIAHARMGDGQEVYPSQELILDDSTNKKGKKSKTLYTISSTAAMHSQKIGNALRTVDTWYPGQMLGPIAVEPYGSVTTQGCAYRQPKDKLDFYSLLDGWVLKDKVPADEQQHFVMANLIRGGVFGD